MDSEHESEDEFNQNDDNRSDDGSERGGDAEDDSGVNQAPATGPEESATADRTHVPLKLQPNILDCKTFDIMPCAGILTSYWENEEQPNKLASTVGENGIPVAGPSSSSGMANSTDMDLDTNVVKREGSAEPGMAPANLRASSPEESKMSAVYSLDCHSEAVFAISGLESGSINLWTPRHEEGTCHHVFRQHTAPVSALKLTPDEHGFISGSWDHSVLQWDLNYGTIVRTYNGHGSQVSSLSFQPMEMPTPTMDLSSPTANCSNDAVLMSTSVDASRIYSKNKKNMPGNKGGRPRKVLDETVEYPKVEMKRRILKTAADAQTEANRLLPQL
ncbi:Transcription factor spt8, partial [Mortierella sp. AD011]